ncbi:uncharacterized protein MKK02DRAFT_42204 [Dioszegia hungarica]|uniref:DUF7918 domain-containing protein n=1 Tax=Dioszegia hungarica TaxID=4972 RepID=A0AA38LXU7_9TREE|nr:uncharacterized protein MKK02DRAFT_42204 [Dioszegia hungarica]KAI9637831.1 hypothetical protein MKK02DRAFT_42204 [Dioszegia hungarica]
MVRGIGAGRNFEVYLEYRDKKKTRIEEFHPNYTHPLEDEEEVADDETEASTREGATATVWVECEAGMEYQIVIEDRFRGKKKQKKRPAREAVRASIEVDGRDIHPRLLFYGSTHKYTTSAIDMEQDGQVGSYRLRFAAVDAVDDRHEAELDADGAAQIGTIKVTLELGAAVDTAPREWSPEIIEEIGTAWEKDIKVKGGQKVKVRAGGAGGRKPQWVDFESTNAVYFYTFVISYAHRAVIDRQFDLGKSYQPEARASTVESDGEEPEFIERPPTPPPGDIASRKRRKMRRRSPSVKSDSPSDPESEESDGAAYQEFLKQRAARKLEAKEAKRRKREDEKRVKDEQEERIFQAGANLKGEVYDLTADSD